MGAETPINEVKNGKQRTIGNKAGIYSAFGRMCHRMRKCVEISLDVRTVWRRRICTDLCDLSDSVRTPCHDHGICSGTGGTGKSYPHVSEAGEKGSQVAYPWLCGTFWEYCPDGFLYRGIRMDTQLFCEISDGAE